MSRLSVDATTSNALAGLYLTPDMGFSAMHLISEDLDETVDRMHSVQPLTHHFERFADIVTDTTHGHLLGINSAVLERFDALSLTRAYMAFEDLASTYFYFKRGLAAAVCVALSVYQRTHNITDLSAFRRVIPHELDDMRITSLGKIDQATLHQILMAEPWVSWLERLRAQRARSMRVIAESDLIMEKVAAYAKTIPKKLASLQHRIRRDHVRAGRKSIKRAIKMHERFGSEANLRAFLASSVRNPLVIQGYRFDYHLVMKPGLLNATIDCDQKVAPVETSIYNKTGQRICGICLYFDEVPPLDYIMATSLLVRNEETEMDVLKAAWVVDTPRDFYDDPIMPELKGLTDPVQSPTLVQNVFAHADFMPRELCALRDGFIEKYLPTAFQATVKIMGFGNQYFPIMRQTSKFSLLDFMCSTEGAKSAMTAAQNALMDGRY